MKASRRTIFNSTDILKSFIQGRDVAIIGSAPSIEKIQKIKTNCLLAINNLEACEAIGVSVNILWCTSDSRFHSQVDEIYKFTKRSTVFLVTRKHLAEKYCIEDYIDSEGIMKGHGSIAGALAMLSMCEVKNIHLFGMDGFAQLDKPYYKKSQFFNGENDQNPDLIKSRIEEDTNKMNCEFWQDMEKITEYKSKIVNVTDKSDLKCFEEITLKKYESIL